MKRISIRIKMWTILSLLLLLVLILALAGIYAVRLYKNQVRDVAWRANVLPAAGKLSGHVGQLRTVLGELRGIRRNRFQLTLEGQNDRIALESKFRKSLFEVKQIYNEYQELLEERVEEIGADDRFHEEFSTVHEIRRAVQGLSESVADDNWGFAEIETIENQLDTLQQLTEKLPNHLHEELKGYSLTMKHQARWLYSIVLFCVVVSMGLMLMLICLSYTWIFGPLGVLIEGSRKVAAGTFQYRITLKSQDEMAELADAMNQMTERFEDIRRDLGRKVRQGVRELIRSERLASVGFLAAGVAHEINNPLTAISTCAESLQRRIVSTLAQDGRGSDETEFAKRYLKMIQDEAFRCKGITEKLLSFARSETKDREWTDLPTLVTDIVEMTRQHDAFKDKVIRLELPESLSITANPQEIKQVVLNLLTNALHCTERDGTVTVRLRQEKDRAVLTIVDDGIGMDENILKNLFEPFFTRREQGQGTGLGLAITHRIVEDHHGHIEAFSDGPGKGSTLLVELPIGAKS